MKAASGEMYHLPSDWTGWIRRKKTIRRGGELAGYYWIKHELRYFEV